MSASLVSSKEILTKTGIKNAKTLTRWHQRGIIPEPILGTHPSGRGKMAFWPDWVLDRCMEVVNLQRQGHSLTSANTLIEMEETKKLHEEKLINLGEGGKGKSAILNELIKHNEDKSFPVVFWFTHTSFLDFLKALALSKESETKDDIIVVIDGMDKFGLDTLQNTNMPEGIRVLITSREKQKGKGRRKNCAKTRKGRK